MRDRCLVVAAAAMLFASPAAASPKVVASIKPIHALVSAVMAGVGEPALIVAGASSPHLYTLRPSDAEHLAAAEIVFWVGPIFEGFLAKPLGQPVRRQRFATWGASRMPTSPPH